MEQFLALIQKTPMSHKLAAVGMVLVLMGVGHYFFVYTDQEKALQGLDRQLAKLEEELEDKREKASNLTLFKKKVEFLQQKLKEKEKNLPSDANMDQLLKTLNALSEKSDMRIIKFTPKSEVNRNFYAEIPVAVQLEGNYHEVATFFDKISKEERIINITDIDFSKPTLRNGKVVLSGKCLAKTFKAMPVKKKGKKKGKPGKPGKPGKKH